MIYGFEAIALIKSDVWGTMMALV